MVALSAMLLLLASLLVIAASRGHVAFGHGPRERAPDPPQRRYVTYFAYGSNMLPATMESLRSIRNYGKATAAVLPDYKIVFRGAAGVEKCLGSQVHGVLYQLDPRAFATVSMTEGVPVAYQWVDCRVVPYIGDGEQAGESALEIAENVAAQDGTASFVPAKTLVMTNAPSASALLLPPSLRRIQSLPSKSYLRILQQGAKYWKLDQSYQAYLEQAPTSLRDGLEGPLLEMAMLFNPPTSLS